MPSDMEGLVLDGLDVNDPDGIYCESLEWKPAAKILEWIKSADTDGARLLRRPKHDNAVMTLKLRVSEQASMDDAVDLIQSVVDKLQRAERLSAGGRSRGLELAVAPANSNYSGTVYVLTGEIEDLPRDWQDSGWFVNNPTFTVRLDCHPFIYGDEIVYPASPSTDSTPLHTLVVPDVGGDVDAEARLIFTDMASQNRDYVRWWLENAGYQPGTNLLIDSDAMVTAGMAGTQTTRAGAWDVGGGNNVIRATLTTTPVAVCSTAELIHIGVFDDLVRVYASAAGVKVRLAYRVGQGQWYTLPWVTPPVFGKWAEVDLGRVTLPAAVAGTQGAVLRFEAISDTAGDTIDVDYTELGPTGDVGAGTARRSPLVLETPVAFSARDEFAHSGNLTGKTAPVGGVWAGAGDAADFTVASANYAERTTASDAVDVGRYVTLPVSLPAVMVGMDFLWAELGLGGLRGGLLAHYTNTTATFRAYIEEPLGDSAPNTWNRAGRLVVTANGVELARNDNAVRLIPNTPMSLAIAVLASGEWAVWAGPKGAVPRFPIMWGATSSLATGGAVATGRIGIYDEYSGVGTVTRHYSNLAAWVPAADAACFSGRSTNFRGYGDDACIRQDTAGTYYGVPGEYRGGRFSLPPGTSRVALLARRTDTARLGAENVTDGGRLQVAYRERRLALPG